MAMSCKREIADERNGEVAAGKAAARRPAAMGNHPGVRIPSLSATAFFSISQSVTRSVTCISATCK